MGWICVNDSLATSRGPALIMEGKKADVFWCQKERDAAATIKLRNKFPIFGSRVNFYSSILTHRDVTLAGCDILLTNVVHLVTYLPRISRI